MRALGWLQEIVTREVDARLLGVVRIVIGIDALLRCVIAYAVAHDIFQPDALRLPYIPHLPVPAADVLPLLYATWFVAALLFTFGFVTTWAGIVLSASMFYSLLMDQQTYSNHVYLLSIITFLLALARSGNRLSVDARHGRGSATAPYWPVLLLKLQLTIVYFYSAVFKLNGSFLSGESFDHFLRTEGPLAIPAGWHGTTIMSLLAVGVIIAELWLAFGLWFERTRVATAAFGVFFHASLVVGMHTQEWVFLIVFGIEMTVLYLLFFLPFAPARAAQQEDQQPHLAPASASTARS